MDYQNLRFLQDAFYATQGICSWTLSDDGQLLYSNCPEQDFFFGLFSLGRCREEILRHFAENRSPIIAADRTGFVWTAVLQPADEEQERDSVIHLLGPVFTSAMTDESIRRQLREHTLTASTQRRLEEFLRTVPAISSDTALRFVSMLQFAAGAPLSGEETVFWNEGAEKAADSDWGNADWHGDMSAEKQFTDSITQGRFVDLSKITTGRIGDIGGGDPLRQAKNQLIVFSVLCSRAAIEGGVSAEGALALSDFFITRAEAESSVSAVSSIGLEMYRTYIQRVRRAQEEAGCSPLVRACSEYIETHIFEKIRLADMAAAVGYTETYISRTFKKETGTSLTDAVNQRKVELAKRLLRETPVSAAELSDRLSFSSASYFSSVFKKCTGLTPAEYQSGAHSGREAP